MKGSLLTLSAAHTVVLGVPAIFHMLQTDPNFTSQISTSSAPPAMLVGTGRSSIELNMWNPVYALAPFVLVVVSIPLAIGATITTSFAVTLLACRAAVVYVQLTVALIGAWVDPRASKLSIESVYPPPTPSPEGKSPTRQRHLHGNISSTSSQETIVPAVRALQTTHNSLPFKVSVVTNEVARDFEGVGGWRTPGDDDEEALWMNMNSRLELPREAPRRHQRSLTGGSSPNHRRSWSPESLRMSPVQSRARTPVRFAVDEGDYFPPQTRTNIRRGSNASESSKGHKRRKSESSSGSSTSLGIMIAVKEAGE